MAETIGGDSHIRYNQSYTARLGGNLTVNSVFDAHSAQAGDFQHPVRDAGGRTVYVTEQAAQELAQFDASQLHAMADFAEKRSLIPFTKPTRVDQRPAGKPEQFVGNR